MADSFMQPELYAGAYYEVDTIIDGVYFVPAEYVTHTATESTLRDYVDSISDPDTWTVRLRNGYLARLSAPGYLDCTDWIGGTNKRALLRELKELYS